MKKIFIAIALLFLSLLPVKSQDNPWQYTTPEVIQFKKTLVIKKDLGGDFNSYIVRYGRMKEDDATLAIDGECTSACTLFMNTIQPDHVCITTNAKIGIHRSNTLEGNIYFMMNYPLPVQMWIFQAGIEDNVKYLPDEMIRMMWRKCPMEALYPTLPPGEKADPEDENMEG